MNLRPPERRDQCNIWPEPGDRPFHEVSCAHQEDLKLPIDRQEIDERVALRHVLDRSRDGRNRGKAAREQHLLGWAKGVEARDDLNRIAVELDNLAALARNELGLRKPIGAQHIDMRFGSQHHRCGLPRNIGDIGDVIIVTMADQDLVGLRNVLVNESGFQRQGRIGIRLIPEIPRISSADPGVEKNGLIAKTEFPSIGP